MNRHKANAKGDCIKCGDTTRFNHIGPNFCPIPDDEEDIRCADAEKELGELEK